MLRIGLTGGTGFIGQYLIKEYGEKYHFVVTTSKTEFNNLAKNAEYVNCEYTYDSFKQVFQGCDAVVHLGGHVMQGLDANINIAPFLPNITLADNVFSACLSLGITNIINASSVAVYDQIGETPTCESAPLYPNSVYGITKITIEKLAELYNRNHGLKIKSLRYGQGVGYSQSKKADRFWSILLNNCLEKKEIPIWGRGITGRDIIYVKDMAYAAICAIEHPEEKGEYNIGTQRISTNKEIAEAFCKVFENDAGIVFVEGITESGIRTCMDCTKAKTQLGFEARFDLFSMVEDIKREYECNNNTIS